jgi:hypothetical protein
MTDYTVIYSLLFTFFPGKSSLARWKRGKELCLIMGIQPLGTNGLLNASQPTRMEWHNQWPGTQNSRLHLDHRSNWIRK